MVPPGSRLEGRSKMQNDTGGPLLLPLIPLRPDPSTPALDLCAGGTGGEGDVPALDRNRGRASAPSSWPPIRPAPQNSPLSFLSLVFIHPASDLRNAGWRDGGMAGGEQALTRASQVSSTAVR